MAKNYCGAGGSHVRLLERLHRLAAIETRRTVLDTVNLNEDDHEFFKAKQPSTSDRMERYKKEIAPLALTASSASLAQANVTAKDIGNLVTVSCTGFVAPGMDIALINGLGLPADVSRTHVGFMGCHGAINGLRAAASLTETSQKNTLLVAAELCSLHFQYGNKRDDLMANALFADGSAAVVLSPDGDRLAGDQGSASGAYSCPPMYRLVGSSSYLLPDSQTAMTWDVGDHGFTMTLGSEIPNLIEANLKSWLIAWLARFDLTMSDIGAWAVHPGGPRILDAVEAALSLPPEALAESRGIFSRYGNMSSPTVLFILERLASSARGRPTVGPTVAMAFGPGLTIECALLK